MAIYYNSFNIPVELYDEDIVQCGEMNETIMSFVTDGIESLKSKNIAILAPGLIAKYVKKNHA